MDGRLRAYAPPSYKYFGGGIKVKKEKDIFITEIDEKANEETVEELTNNTGDDEDE